MSVARGPVDVSTANEITTDLSAWIGSGREWSDDRRFRSELRRYLQRRVRRRPHPDGLSVDRTVGARGPDFVVGESIAIVVLDTITDGSKRWLYREFGFIGQQYEHVVVIGFHIPEEHMDVWRSLGRRMEKRSASKFEFIGIQQPWQSRSGDGFGLRPLAVTVGLGVVLIGWVSFASNFYTAVAATDQLAGAFVAGIALFLALVIVYCTFFLRYF